MHKFQPLYRESVALQCVVTRHLPAERWKSDLYFRKSTISDCKKPSLRFLNFRECRSVNKRHPVAEHNVELDSVPLLLSIAICCWTSSLAVTQQTSSPRFTSRVRCSRRTCCPSRIIDSCMSGMVPVLAWARRSICALSNIILKVSRILSKFENKCTEVDKHEYTEVHVFVKVRVNPS